jgi:hypothetical protein
MSSKLWVTRGDDDVSMCAFGEKVEEINVWIICIIKEQYPLLNLGS